MGNSIKETFDQQGRINWKIFESREFYVLASERNFKIERKFFVDVESNLMKGLIFELFLKKIVEFWQNDYFVANLLIILKQFLEFNLEDQKDLTYLYFTNSNDKLQEAPESIMIPLNFHYNSEKITLTYDIGTSSFFHLQNEPRLILSLLSEFPSLTSDLKAKNGRICLKTLQNDIISIETLLNSSSSQTLDTLVNPFEELPIKSPIDIKIEIKQQDFNTVFHNFLKSILHSISISKLGVFSIRSHALINFLLTALSLHFSPKNENDLYSYKPLEPSNILKYFKEIDELDGLKVSLSLLDFVADFSDPPSRFTYFSSFFANSLDLRLAEIEADGPKSGLFLLLLLNCYSSFADVFFIRDVDLKWVKFRKFFSGMMKDEGKLLLFTVLLVRNSMFLNDFVNSLECARVLKEIIQEISENPGQCFKNDLVLISFLKLTENKTFLMKSFKEKENLSYWLSYAELSCVNLGSLLFLAMIRVIKENLKTKQFDHVHTYASSILFNLLTSMIDLHEVSSNEYLLFIKVLYSNYSKNYGINQHLADIFKDTCHVYIEYLGKIFQKGLDLNPNIIKSCLNHSEFFKFINTQDISFNVVKEIVKCLEVFEKSLERDDDSEYQLKITCKLQGFGPIKSQFWNFNECRYLDEFNKWEAFAVPQVWKMILQYRQN